MDSLLGDCIQSRTYLRVELNRLTPKLIELLLADNVSGYND